MDLEYGEEYEAFRESVRVFLKGWPLQGDAAKRPLDEREAIFRKNRDGTHLLCHQDGVSQGKLHHTGREADALGDRREEGDQAECLEEGLVLQERVVAIFAVRVLRCGGAQITEIVGYDEGVIARLFCRDGQG